MIWKMSIYYKAHLTSATHALRLIQKVVGQNVRVNTCSDNQWHHRPGHDQDKAWSLVSNYTAVRCYYCQHQAYGSHQ